MWRVLIVLGGLLLAAQAARVNAAPVRRQVEHARQLIESGKTADALREIRTILDGHTGDPEAQFEAGSLLQQLAGITFERLVRLAPDSVQAHELLGNSFEARGQLKEALSEYRLAIQKDPHAPGLHFLVGNVLWKNRDFDAAAPELEAELRANPGHALANARIGNIWIARGDPERAIRYLEEAVRGAPSSIEARRDLGKAYRHAGKLGEALQHFLIVAREQPEDESVHAQLAAVYRAMGDSAKAAQELRLQRDLLQRRAEAAREKN